MKKFIILLLVVSIFLVSCSSKEKEEVVETKTPEVETVVEEEKVEPVETVAEVPEEKEVKVEPIFSERYPFAVMIDNHFDARPQSGIKDASIIYEAYVEGSLTRLMLLIDNEETLVGPIRSARMHFVSLMSEEDAIYAHVGGSNYAISELRSGGYKDFDQFSYGLDAYYRSDHRYAPHNVYATIGDLYESARNTGYTVDYPEGEASNLMRYETPMTYDEGEDINRITLSYDSYTPRIYEYDSEKEKYFKYNGEYMLLDERTDEAVEIEGILVMSKPTGYFEDGVHVYVEMEGSGKAYYYTHGKKIELDWQKEYGDHTKYTYNGEPFAFNPGLNFINVISTDMEVVEE